MWQSLTLKPMILIPSLTFFPLLHTVLEEYAMAFTLCIKKTNQRRIQGSRGGEKGSLKIPVMAL